MDTKTNFGMNSEETVLENSTNAAGTTAGAGRKIWKKCLVGGVPGIILGATGTLVGSSLAAAEPAVADNPEEPSKEPEANPEIGNTVSVAGSVTDDMTFSEAFAAARHELGAGGVFTWHGNVYGTYYQDEWNAMSDEQRQAYAQAVSATHVQAEPYTPAANEEPVVVTDPEGGNGQNPASENGGAGNAGTQTEGVGQNGQNPEPAVVATGENVGTNEGDEVDIHVLDVVQVENGVGMSYIGVAEVDGHHAEFHDLNGDGVVDLLAVDMNDNGTVDEGEVFSTEGAGIHVSDLVAAAAYEHQSMPDDNLYADMPDYTNDADTSSLA